MIGQAGLQAMRNNFSLYADDGTPAVLVNGKAQSDFFLICEHASRQIPAALGTMGLSPQARRSHIAWDIGAAAVARQLARALDAPLVLQRYSRLVFDCNRPPGAPAAIPEVSEATRIPGNENLSQADKTARTDDLYHPFHAKVAAMIDQRQAAGLDPIIVTVHSFTPVYLGKPRDVELGIVHDEDARFADAMLDAAARDPSYICRRNDPYGPEDGVTHTLKLHSHARGLLNVMLEIRNDRVATRAGQTEWARRVAHLLETARAALPTASATETRSASG